MIDLVLAHEGALRLSCFLGALLIMLGWEQASPRRVPSRPRRARRLANLSLVIIDAALIWLLLPAAAVGASLLARAHAQGAGFRWAAYYEAEGNIVAGVTGSPDPTVAQLTSDLNYLQANYAGHPNYLRMDGKPVVFVYSTLATSSGSDGTQSIEQRPNDR